jgi:NAD(P)-dependent dehydrogenase (short-subunit alcohol dehydrogenase family)
MTQGKVMLITGSNSGIGNATAKGAVAAGFTVYGGARRQETFPAIQAVGAQPLCLDVTNEDTMVAAVRQIEAKYGAVDVLVNNAGFGQMGPIEEITREQWLYQYETNVFGLVRMAQLVIPAMRHQGRGRIINISSMGGEFTFPLAGAYHSTKYAVESINEALRFELRPFGIEVITIQPGPVSTPLAATAVDTLPTLPDSPYVEISGALRRMSQRNMGYISPEQAARVIVNAAQAQRPRPRYKIGMMAQALPMLHTLLSDRMWDRLMSRFYA